MYESKNKSKWFSMIQSEKKIYKIDLSDKEVPQMSKTKSKSFINFKVNSEAYLQMVNTKKSKLEMIIKTSKQGKDGKSKPQPYLFTNKLTTEMKQMLFELRCRNFDVKSNQKSYYGDNMSCGICNDEDSYENEIHTSNVLA